ncbi:hypothetical protein GCM10017083_34330 [Thalassobaculum fulvum]|jgi:uncharacterized protein YdcH (DUF465 family)|uniref:GTP-binding protein n=1 Tax=Thalassobaculum fulvum TaxID=1633335 RepID=A0A918XUS4_9PROT|nr:YdcH family protein [Thalassobaculum fulvum]GHD55425.1 hypothetical protein GCM10017083_34330 [Thalassobaculum fulvum]
MGDFHHDIGTEFPEYRDRIHDLKTGNAHFARLYDQYHDLDKQIARIEQEIEPTTDEHAEELKRQRVKLKDEIFGMLRAG